MFILGLAGQAGVGKDTVANYLERRYGFVKFAFAAALRQEVAEAWHHIGITEDILLDRKTKEAPHPDLTFVNCGDLLFVNQMETVLRPINYDLPLSPRQVLQLWGTEYRRAQDSDYWVKRLADSVEQARAGTYYPEHRPQFFVCTDARFSNEQEWIQSTGGNLWHIHRGEGGVLHDHASARPLPILPRERQLWNNDSIDRLHAGIDLLLSTMARFVRVEPMEPYGKTETEEAVV